MGGELEEKGREGIQEHERDRDRSVKREVIVATLRVDGCKGERERRERVEDPDREGRGGRGKGNDHSTTGAPSVPPPLHRDR